MSLPISPSLLSSPSSIPLSLSLSIAQYLCRQHIKIYHYNIALMHSQGYLQCSSLVLQSLTTLSRTHLSRLASDLPQQERQHQPPQDPLLRRGVCQQGTAATQVQTEEPARQRERTQTKAFAQVTSLRSPALIANIVCMLHAFL